MILQVFTTGEKTTMNYKYRRLEKNEIDKAFELVKKVFDEFEAPEYPEEGVTNFHNLLKDENYKNEITCYGAFDQSSKKIVGMIATRSSQTHITLFFVDKNYHRQGIGKSLFELVKKNCPENLITVNSSPYATKIYGHLGFIPTGPEEISDGIRYTHMEYYSSRNLKNQAFPENSILNEFLLPTNSIDFQNSLIQKKVEEIKKSSQTEIDYIKNCFEFVRDKITHSWDVKAQIVSKTASEVLINGTGICWTKSCLLCALLRANKIPAGICYQKLTRADDASDGYIIHALNTVYISQMNKWIRLDARGNKENVNAQFSLDQEILAYPVRKEFNELSYNQNFSDLDPRLIQILNTVDMVMNIRTDDISFE